MAAVILTSITSGTEWYWPSPSCDDATGVHDVAPVTCMMRWRPLSPKMNDSRSPTRADTSDGRKNCGTLAKALRMHCIAMKAHRCAPINSRVGARVHWPDGGCKRRSLCSRSRRRNSRRGSCWRKRCSRGRNSCRGCWRNSRRRSSTNVANTRRDDNTECHPRAFIRARLCELHISKHAKRQSLQTEIRTT